MTRNEWKERCAARYVERAGLSPETARDFAEACFEAQDGEFSTAADYNPEDCADEDMNCWTHDE